MTYSFPNLEPVCCSMSRSNCFFFTCIQISQEAGQVVWYSHLLKNFPQFVVIHTIKGFGIVNKPEAHTFLQLYHFFDDATDVGNLISGSSAFPRGFCLLRGFPCGSDGKLSSCNAGDLGLIPGLGRFPGEGSGNPLQCSCLENPMDRGAWWASP